MRKTIILKPNKWTDKDLEKTYLYQYREAIRSGEIKAGKELITCLDNLLEDLNDEEYYFDSYDADLRIDFIESIVKLTKSPFYGQPMKLMLFQKAFIECLYSFKMSEDNTRRFQRTLYLIARKNGKSELSSALALAEFLIGGSGIDIVCSSNDDNQASILTDAIDTMRKMIDPKDKVTKRNIRNILCKVNNNKIFKLSDKTQNKEGRNIDLGIVDEVHEMKENVIVKSIEQSQSLKINPLLILITTEGFVNDGFLDNELIRARGILNKEIQDAASKRYLPWLYTMDGEYEVWQGNKENRLWEKANPTLGTVKKYSYLEQQIDTARYSKKDRNFVFSKDFNIKQSNATAWLKTEDYDYEEVFDLEDFRGSLCLGAVDLAETTDLTSAKIILVRPGDRKKYIHSMYFIPEGKLEKNDDNSAGAKYKEWASKGLLRIEDGNYLNTAVVADWFFELYKKYGLRPLAIGYDVKFANEFLHRMEEYGFETEIILQRAEVLSPSISMVEVDLKDKLIIGLSEVDKWCLSNATLRVDNKGFGILEKIKGQNGRRIDGSVTLCMCFEMLKRHSFELNR